LIERLPFTYLHVFSFSERPGTEASKLRERAGREVIRERARNLRALSSKKAGAFRASQAGRIHRALTLARNCDEWTEALTGNYLKVRIAGRRSANQWCDVRLPLDPATVASAIRLSPPPIRTAAQSEDPRAWPSAPESSKQVAPLL
jgi:tRNA A37 methylthiotransferase MiaB